ncbi:acetyl-CoA carboxylase biotin carboxylase subunit family protein (plasmid) [Rhizobium sp. CB3171]|uniref:ATP-grasp domain-containing protein n=1 Tax=Rhizobium sp. CB3171 TaxID=3039157 RepID=UPI0024B0CFDD|nr:acetyl-CoA carboxylase biotin carboxylase subunit family protein [Rhizobium sp. CB3171]WFU06710.1 acetyl-CoA carboxylase biotin carboxylase subunit family protein [Rhizobium sp. CB3171]
MTTRALILIEGNEHGTGLQYVRAAENLGLHAITLSADPAQYNYLAAEGVEAIQVDTDSLDALIYECSRLRETYEIAGITSAQEKDNATVGKLCRHFDLPGPNPESIEQCCDKFTQRQLLAEAGVPVPAYRLATNAAEVESSAAEIGLPVVVKPAVGGIGCIGVRLCRTIDELAEHTTYLLGGKHIWSSAPRVLIEEFARGPFYEVDTMGDEVIGISAADFDHPPHFRFRESIFPALLTDEEHERITNVSRSCLKALSLGWGPSNIELRWTIRGPVVIEVNPRMAGGTRPGRIQLAYGIDLVTEHLKLVIGAKWDLRRRYLQTTAVRFLLPDSDGILEWIEGNSRAAAVPGVVDVSLYVQPKMSIVKKGDYRDRIGHVIAASPSFAQAKAILQHAAELIDWSIAPFTIPSQQEQAALLASQPPR